MVHPPEAGFVLRGSCPLSSLASEDSQRILRCWKPYSLSCKEGEKAAAGVPGLPCSALGSRRERKGLSVTATSRASQKSRIVHMGSSQRAGKASGQSLRGDLQRNAEARGSGGVGVVVRGRESRTTWRRPTAGWLSS